METTQTTSCSKCNGTGRVVWKHIENGKCFQCYGSGHASVRESRTAAQRRAPVDAPYELETRLRTVPKAIADFGGFDRDYWLEMQDECSTLTLIASCLDTVEDPGFYVSRFDRKCGPEFMDLVREVWARWQAGEVWFIESNKRRFGNI